MKWALFLGAYGLLAGTDTTDIVRALDRVLSQPKGTVWLGSGLSTVAGYPAWSNLIQMLCTECGLGEFSASGDQTDDLQARADECKDASPDAYRLCLEREFSRVSGGDNKSYERLVRLGFHTYLTTNFDPLLAEAASDVGNSIYAYPDLLPDALGEQGSVFYIHGLAVKDDEPFVENLVLSKSDFAKAYSSELLKGIITSVLVYRPIVFLGCKLQEAELIDAIKRAQNLQHELVSGSDSKSPPERLILLAKDELQVATEAEHERVSRANLVVQQYDALGIKVLWYDRIDRHYTGFTNIVRELCKQKGIVRTPKLSSGLDLDGPL